MDLAFTEEQQMLRRVARGFLEKEFPKTLVRQMEDDPTCLQPDLWRTMAEMGWLGLAIPPEYGGVGGSFLDVFVLMEEMGRACLVAPFFSTILCSLAILDAGSEEQKQALLPRVSDGELVLALALTESSATYEAGGVATTAVPQREDFVVSGTKLFVQDANAADYLLCVARTSPATSAAEGISLFVVDATSPGIEIEPLPTIGDGRQHEVRLQSVRVPRGNMLGLPDKGWPTMSKLLERAALAKCAEMIGGLDWTIETSLAYAKDRIQYGRPIGSFQVIQHYLSDMWTEINHAKWLTYRAAWRLDQGLPCATEAAMAKAQMSETYTRCTRMGVQIHGGIGTNREHDMGLYYRRAREAAALFGNPDFWREKVAVGLGL